jgi:hypothetical protein
MLEKLDIAAFRANPRELSSLTRQFTQADLRALTNEAIDAQLAMLKDASDADVVFTPIDANANDTFGKPEEQGIAWNAAHIIVHVTASSEESAAIALSLARGIAFEGRSRYETNWQDVTTVAQCRARLEESRRMRLAMLEAWPNSPDLTTLYKTTWAGDMNAITRFCGGMFHEVGHFDQLRDALVQAKAAKK